MSNDSEGSAAQHTAKCHMSGDMAVFWGGARLGVRAPMIQKSFECRSQRRGPTVLPRLQYDNRGLNTYLYYIFFFWGGGVSLL